MLPAYIGTDRQRELAGLYGDLDKATAGIPLRRFAEPEEFGRAAAFLPPFSRGVVHHGFDDDHRRRRAGQLLKAPGIFVFWPGREAVGSG